MLKRLRLAVTVIVISGTLLWGQDYSSAKDSLRVMQYGNRAFELRSSQADSALWLTTEAIKLATPARDSQSLVNLWRTTGVVHYGRKEYGKAETAFTTSYKLARKINFREGRLIINLGNVAFQQKNYPKAIARFEEALELSAGKDTLAWMDAATNLAGANINSNNYRRAIPYLETALLLQQATDKDFAQLPILYNLGYAQVKLDNRETGIATYEKGIALARRLKKMSWVGTFLKKIAAAYSEAGLYPQSITVYQQVMSLYDSLGDTRNANSQLFAIGIVHQKGGDYPLALKYLQRSLDSIQTTDNYYAQATTLNSIGNNYKERGEYALAMPFYYRSKRLWERIGRTKKLYYPLYNLGDAYERMGQLDSALYYLNLAEDKTDGLNKSYQEALVRTSLGKVFYRKGEFQQAENYFREAIKLAREEGLNKEERDASWELYQLLKQQSQPAAALPYLERYQQLQDSLFNEQSVREIANLETTFSYEKEKARIAERNERESRLFEEQIYRQRRWQFIFGLAFLLSLLGAFLYVRFQRYRQAAELKIEHQERVKLEEIDAFRSRFFANISHELRTPLTLILGPVRRLLRQGNWSQNDLVQIQLIQDNAQQLRTRVEEILDLTRLEAGHLRLNKVATTLYSFTGRLMASFESYAQQKNQQLSFSYLPDKDLSVLLDQSKFAHVLNNLLSNAIKFTPEGGEVSVSIAEHEEIAQCLVLKITDNGPGIRPEDLPHLFDRYYQAKDKSNSVGGSGIGLALSKEIAHAMNATIRVESTWGEGSVLYFEFPYQEILGVATETILPMTDTVKVEAFTPDNPAPGTQAEILIVEDNKQLRDYLQFTLSDHFRVTTARNGVEALDKLANGKFHLVVSDVMMPQMDGFELLTRIKSSVEYLHLPVIMLTARSEMKDKLQALRIGVDDYILKPFVDEELLARIQNLIAHQKQRNTLKPEDKFVKEASTQPRETRLSAADLEWLAQLEAILREEVSDTSFTMHDVEARLFISRSNLQRRIKKITGLSPNKYFREIKLQAARELLESGKVETVKEVASAVGFDTAHYFSSIYKKRFGKRPAEWL